LNRAGIVYTTINLVCLLTILPAGCHNDVTESALSSTGKSPNTQTTTAQPTLNTATNASLLVTFSGLGDKITDIFTIDSSPWYIEYSCWKRDTDSPMRFSIFIYPSGENINYIDSVLFISEAKIDTIIEKVIGSYYIRVVGYYSFWTIKIFK
jgi:hypothetical protein